MQDEKIKKIINELKKDYMQLNEYNYIFPDDRKYIQIGNLIKYINIKKIGKPKTGIVINMDLNYVFLKSLNSNLTWSIKFAENFIFYKFDKDYLIDAVNELIEKNEKIT
jgi:hypothetical protein